MENQHFQWVIQLSTAIFNSYVKLPEGTIWEKQTLIYGGSSRQPQTSLLQKGNLYIGFCQKTSENQWNVNSSVLHPVLDTSTHIDQKGDFQSQSWESPNSRFPEHRDCWRVILERKLLLLKLLGMECSHAQIDFEFFL